MQAMRPYPRKKSSLSKFTSVCVSIVLASITREAHAQALVGLGFLPGRTSSTAAAISSDGHVVVGNSTSPSGTHAYRWTAAGGMEDLLSYNSSDTWAYGVSGDGAVVAGKSSVQGDLRWGSRWTSTTGWVRLPVPGSGSGFGIASSGDGASIAGDWSICCCHHYESFWNLDPISSTSTWLQNSSSPGCINCDTTVRAVSSDGQYAVGAMGYGNCENYSQCFVVRWNRSGIKEILGDPGGTGAALSVGWNSFATGVNQDGTVIAATSRLPSGTYHAFRWNQTNGWRDLGALSGGDSRSAAVNADGSVIVGKSNLVAGGDYRATIWTNTDSMLDLNAYLAGLGVDPSPTGWTLTEATGVSADGLTIVGNGLHNGIAEAWIVTLPADSDLDGIPDVWEQNGVPYTDSHGTARLYILDANGDGVSDADWRQKDVFVEVDAMAGHAPAAVTLLRVVDAFNPSDRILVPPPQITGGLPNVRLHIQTDPTDPGADRALSLAGGGNYTLGQGGFGDFGFDKSRYFGMPGERSNPEWAAMREAKHKVYRYCIFANTHSFSSSSGVAEGIPCDDFMVTLGTTGGTPDEQAGTFMHELGHSLGLQHGGGDGINWKPNYYSIMNYTWQMPKPWHGTAWGLRYSEVALPTLDENALSEHDGLGANLPGVQVQYRHVTQLVCPTTSCSYTGNSTVCSDFAPMGPNAPVDWDGYCFAGTPGLVQADINNFSELARSADPSVLAAYGLGRTLLPGYRDWVNLRYNFRCSPHYAPGASADDIGCSYDSVVSTFLDSLGTFTCDPIDFNHDTLFPDTQDIADFLTVFAGGVCDGQLPTDPPCNSDIDFNNDTLFPDTDDIGAFLRVFAGGACSL